MEVLQQIQEDARLHRNPEFYVKCSSSEVTPSGSPRVASIGVSRKMSSALATMILPAPVVIEAIEKYAIRFRCSDRQGQMFVELVVARGADGEPYLKTAVDRDEPLTLLLLRQRNLEKETYVVSKVIDALK